MSRSGGALSSETKWRLAQKAFATTAAYDSAIASTLERVGVNGSGKHCNWSAMDSEGRNLLEPGATPERNLQVLVFLVATLKGVHRRAGLLRAAIDVEES